MRVHQAAGGLRALWIGVALVVALGVSLAGRPGPAEAHALLVRSDPAHDARLRAAPPQVTAWFSEPLEAGISTLRVVDGAGGRVDQGQTELDPRDPTRMSVALRPNADPGFYTVTWETLSRIDGHIWFGSFDFTVLNPDGSLPGGPRPSVAAAGPAQGTGVVESALAKFGQLLGAVVLVGGLAFALVVARPAAGVLSDAPAVRARTAADNRLLQLMLLSLVLLALAGTAELVLQAHAIGGVGEVGTVLGFTWGKRWLVRQVLLGAAAVAVALFARERTRGGRLADLCLWAALAAALGYLLLVSMVSHAAAVAEGSFWATAADLTHLLAAAVWLGGLLLLALLLRDGRRAAPDEERPRLLATVIQRFSLLAATSVTLLLVSGVFSTLVQIPTWSALLETAYGRTLAIKFALLVPLLAVAALNAMLCRPRLVRASAEGVPLERLRRRITRLATVEALFGAAVLVVVGVLVWQTPARPAVEAGQIQGGAAVPVLAQSGRDPFAYPLVAGSWGLVAALALITAGAILWVWTPRWSTLGREGQSMARIVALSLPVFGVLLALVALFPRTPAPQEQILRLPAPASSTPPSGAAVPATSPPASQPQAFTAAVALRYEAPWGGFVLLEITPFQVGDNTVRVTVLDSQGQPARAESVGLKLSPLEEESNPQAVAPTLDPKTRAWLADTSLPVTGWWVVDVDVAGRPAGSFYLRLDEPSQAPLAYTPPDYASDPAAEALFEQAVTRYEGLSSLRWREQLTSGLLQPTGIGAWVVTDGEAEAPDKVHLHVISPGRSNYELYRTGAKSCTADQGQAWRCTSTGAEAVFDLDFQAGATAFRLGRRELVDGEMSRVLLFYNPQQPAWYAWWVGEESGYLRRQAMVAAGHFMLTRYVDQDAPVEIRLPPEAR